MPLQTSVLSSPSDARALVPQWVELWDRTPTASVFQRPEWLLPWWHSFARDRPVWIFCAHDGGALVGLVGCWLRTDASGRRVLALLGEAVSDYLDAIIAPDRVAAVVGELWRALDTLRDIDGIEFHELRADSPLLADAPEGWSDRVEPQSVCPALSLPSTLGSAADVLPAELAHQLVRARRKLERRGAVRFERADPGTVAAHLAHFFRLHRLRWDRRGVAGVRDADLEAFHASAASQLAACNMLELWTLSLAGRAIASVYALADRGCLRLYLGTFDPEFSACSPGGLAILHVVEQGIAAGMGELDMLRGAEDWKYRWGARARTNVRRILRRH